MRYSEIRMLWNTIKEIGILWSTIKERLLVGRLCGRIAHFGLKFFISFMSYTLLKTQNLDLGPLLSRNFALISSRLYDNTVVQNKVANKKQFKCLMMFKCHLF